MIQSGSHGAIRTLVVVCIIVTTMMRNSVNAFVIVGGENNVMMRPTTMVSTTTPKTFVPFHILRMSEPSDTSSEDFTNADYPGYASTTATTTNKDDVVVDVDSTEMNSPTDVLVSNVMDLLPSLPSSGGGSFAMDVSTEVRSAINEALYKLESLNPNSDAPALSPLINGVWELRYYGGHTNDNAISSPTRQLALFLYSGGYSPGLFALQLASQLPKNPLLEIGELEISISRVQPRIEATIPITFLNGASESSIQVTAKLETQSNMRFRETYETVNVLGTTNLKLPNFFQYSRDLYVTYIDTDLMVLRDSSGIPEILIRKNKLFTNNWGTDPTDIDDTTPPGMPTPSDSDNNNNEASY